MLASHAGRLYLRANHFGAGDCSGSLQATVSGGQHSDDPRPAPGPCLAEAAETAWAGLLSRLDPLAADDAARRQALLDFRHDYAGRAPQVGRANAALANLLARLPSPLDRLARPAFPRTSG